MLQLLHCPVELASGPPLRGAEVVLLWVGRLGAGRLTLTATRSEVDPLEGACSVRLEQERLRVRGDENNSGFVPLRFGYRVEGLPQALRPVELLSARPDA